MDSKTPKEWAEDIVNVVDKLPLEQRVAFIKEVVLELVGKGVSINTAVRAQRKWEGIFEVVPLEEGEFLIPNDTISELAILCGFKSNSELRRIFKQNGVRLRVGKKSILVKLK